VSARQVLKRLAWQCRLPVLGVLFFVAVGSNVWIAAWVWPVDVPLVLKDFAGEAAGGFFTGVLLSNATSELPLTVMAIQAGEIVYEKHGQFRRSRVPWGKERSIVVDHDDGVRAVYGGLAQVHGSAPATVVLKQGDALGDAVGAGYFSGRHVSLQLLDTRRGGFINPLIVLPLLKDERSPVIHDIRIAWQEGDAMVDFKDRAETVWPRPRIFAHVRDYFGGNGALNSGIPWSVKLLLNGQEQFVFEKYAIVFTGFSQMLQKGNGMTPLRVFGHNGYMDLGQINLKEGVNRVEVRASDRAGNRSGVSFRLNYRKKPVEPEAVKP